MEEEDKTGARDASCSWFAHAAFGAGTGKGMKETEKVSMRVTGLVIVTTLQSFSHGSIKQARPTQCSDEPTEVS